MQFTRSTSSRFNDVSFPADQSSLYLGYAGKDSTELQLQATYQKVQTWLTPSDLDEGAPNLWGKLGIRSAAVVQGQLGDCWFISAIAALAEWQDRVKNVFNNQDGYPADGLFQVNLYSAGKIEKVTVDDRLPVLADEQGK